MLVDAKSLDKKEREYDICIIGSGAGGSVVAAKMSEQGFSVLVIEEGPYVTQGDFDQNANKLVPMMYSRSAGLATDDMSIRILQGKVYGGSTTINWMTCLRTPDFVLEQWVKEFGLSNYSPELMKEHFDAVEKRLSVHQIEDSDHSPQNRILLDGCKELGIHVQSSYNNSIDCIGCGTCGLGCPYNAKQDMRMTYLADAQKNGAQIMTLVRGEKILYKGPDSQVVLASVLNENKEVERSIKIKVRRVVVSGGAMFSPLILQSSKLTQGGLVGKYLHLHPVSGVYGLFDNKIYPTYGIPQSTYSEEYLNFNGDGYGWWTEVPDLEPFLAGVSGPGFGKERREIIKNLNNSGVIIVLVRDGANRESNGEVRWRRGFNYQNGSFNFKKVPSIRYKLCEEDEKHLMEGVVNAAEILFAAGAKKVYSLHSEDETIEKVEDVGKLREMKYGANHVAKFSAHPMGTVRMASTPELGVTDETMQMHHYPGVYVMDGSSLPTALGVNPMITILASVSNALKLGNLNLKK